MLLCIAAKRSGCFTVSVRATNLSLCFIFFSFSFLFFSFSLFFFFFSLLCSFNYQNGLDWLVASRQDAGAGEFKPLPSVLWKRKGKRYSSFLAFYFFVFVCFKHSIQSKAFGWLFQRPIHSATLTEKENEAHCICI